MSHIFISSFLEIFADEFRSRVVCEREDMAIQCKKSKRLAIYSATFGRTERGEEQCPLPSGVIAGTMGS